MQISGELKAFLSEGQAQEIKRFWLPLRISPESNWDLYWSSLRTRSECTGPYILSLHNENRLFGLLIGRVEKKHVSLRVSAYWRILSVPVRRIMINSIQIFSHQDSEDLLQRMVSRIVEDLRGGLADIALFEYMPEDSEIFQVLNKFELPLWMRDNIPERSIHRYLTLPSSFNEYQRAHKGMMQKVRKFERTYGGRFQYRLLNEVNEIDEFCSAAEMVSQKTYQRAIGVGFLNNEEDRGMIRMIAAQGTWIAFVALVDDKAVAFWSGCRYGSNVFLLWTSYDQDFQEFSPGLVSFTRLVEHLMDEGATGIDWGSGDAVYKERLGNISRWEKRVCLYAPTIRGMLAHGVRGLDAALGNLIRTRLKYLTNRWRTPLRCFMATQMLRRETKSGTGAGSESPIENDSRGSLSGLITKIEAGRDKAQMRCQTEERENMNNETALKMGDWVEVLPLMDVLATLDGRGQLQGVPFMPEMIPFCGERFKITAVMAKICGGGGGVRAVTGTPLLLLGELRCEGSSHDGCSRLCTLLWKTAWLKPVGGPSFESARAGSGENKVIWPYQTQTGGGAYQCQATALPQATVPMSVAEKLGNALDDVAGKHWGLGQLLKAYARAVFSRMRSMYERFVRRVKQVKPTPIEKLALQPGEWVEAKSMREISATLDQNHKNRGLLFSFYMAPYCGGRYRVKSRMGKFIDEHTGDMKYLENTVILEGVTCTGETTSGMCRRAEYNYWREIWLKRAEHPGDMLIP